MHTPEGSPLLADIGQKFTTVGLSGKDKGGPSEDGFLNNVLSMYTYHQYHYTTIGPYMKIMYYSGNHLY